MTVAAAGLEGVVVFTDIVGFTEYTAMEGDDAALALLDVQSRLVHEALPDGGRVVKELGDGLMLWFPEPCAALLCLLDLQEKFDAASSESMAPLWVRMGMHWGSQARRRDDLVGHDVNLASRIVDVAGPGEVVLSEATIEKIDNGVAGISYEELGPVTMKGIPDPVWLFRAFRES